VAAAPARPATVQALLDDVFFQHQIRAPGDAAQHVIELAQFLGREILEYQAVQRGDHRHHFPIQRTSRVRGKNMHRPGIVQGAFSGQQAFGAQCADGARGAGAVERGCLCGLRGCERFMLGDDGEYAPFSACDAIAAFAQARENRVSG
jgi:hypothetical protein